MFLFWFWLQYQNQHNGYAAETYYVLTAKCPTAEPLIRHRLRTVISCPTGFYRTLWESVTRLPLICTSDKAYPKQLTVLAVQARSPRLLPQLWQTVSSSVSFSISLNCLFRFWILYLWVKSNPKKLILEINAVKCVYVESCYKIFMST